jgi:hypothetical protein
MWNEAGPDAAGYALSTMWRLVIVWMTRAWYNGGLSAEDDGRSTLTTAHTSWRCRA